ncbi:PREDICTED: protein-lysine N-methyltransferase N6AMT2 isoform X2 [Chinchilla lanigera]|uniref:protein-lysine N-methyltransferase N6AMT2 isoform X2 n=1 Tax=Chinchilla lanigera TaxID=34839 RepID=UPI000696D859|nr:PREDICTED: protein-lysine N-methyltransferase N6AMT2 isoform X2 [Chinchilla lanigera]
MSDSDDDTPRLSAYTLAALQEFFAEQKQHTEPSGDSKYNVGIIEENWLSQFWYSRETALRLAQEALSAAGASGRIACVSAPSVYQALRELRRDDISVSIFEYDRRFAVYGEEFVFYDYNRPLDLPESITAQSFDIVIADPPYLSEECLGKTSETIKYLTRGKILLCTGAVMEAPAARLLGVRTCAFIPEHTRSLANEFRCYVNYDSGLDRGTEIQTVAAQYRAP